MDRFAPILESLRKHQNPQMQQVIGAIERYLATGDPATMQIIVASKIQPWLLASAASALGRPGT